MPEAVPGDAPEGVMAAADPPESFEYPPPEDPHEGAVPPGYDWPTHGGYLGCLVGTITAVLVTGFVGADFFSFLWVARHVPGPLFILLTLLFLVVCLIALGRLGWNLGKRFYREYPQPAQPRRGDAAPATERAGGAAEAGEPAS